MHGQHALRLSAAYAIFRRSGARLVDDFSGRLSYGWHRGRFRMVQWGVGAAGKPLAMRSMKRLSSVSLPCLSGHTLRAFSGARRHVAALLSGLLSQNEFGPLLQKARLGTWEPGLSLRLRQWVTRPIREFNNGDFTMYQNRITLIGFLGKDATAVTTTNANFTALSLATKSSYKDKTTGKYIDHTEWHRCIVWGKLAEYAKTLKKGAHLAVEGELRSRESDGQEDRPERARMGSARGFDPEARPRREGQPGRAGGRRSEPRGRGRIGPSSSLTEARRHAGLPLL